MKKLLSIILIITTILSLMMITTISGSAKNIDLIGVSANFDTTLEQLLDEIEIAPHNKDDVASVGVRTFSVSAEEKIPYSDVDGYPYGYIGDVDGDDDVTIYDTSAIQLYIAQTTDFIAIQKILADVDYDGEISIIDATQIQRYLAHFQETGDIFHVIYSSYEDFDPMLDTYDEIVQHIVDNGEYDSDNNCYYFEAVLTEGADEIYMYIGYDPIYGDITIYTITYASEVDSYLEFSITLEKGSTEFSFYSSLCSELYSYYQAWGVGEITDITEDGDIKFNLKYDTFDSYDFTVDDIIESHKAMCLVNLICGEEFIMYDVPGSILNLLYDTTKLM